MLNRTGDTFDAAGTTERFSGMPSFGLGEVLAMVRRQRWVMIVSVLGVLVVGMGIYAQSVRKYTSTVAVLIDAKKVGMSASSPLEGSLTFDSGAIDSQLQILTSDKLADNVARKLGLYTSEAFLDPPSPLAGEILARAQTLVARAIDKLTGTTTSEPSIMEMPEELRRIVAVNTLQGNLKVARSGRAYVLVLEYSDANPQLAMTIAGAYADAYLDDQLESKFDATRRASVWMDDRIRDLKGRALEADQAVQTFRAQHNLTESSGRLLSEQSLTDATTQLSVARGELNNVKSRYDRLREIIDTKQYSAAVTESLGSPIIGNLRTKYLQASKLDSEITAKLGPDHFQAANARKDMAQYERLIFEELTRLLQSYQSDVQINADKVKNLESMIATMRGTNQTDNEAQVKLRSLEQESKTYNDLYGAFLQKFQETTQRETFPVTDARIISQASYPTRPSSPRLTIFLAGSLFGGLLLGGVISALREFRDRGFRTGSQVREELGLDFVANLPMLPRATTRPKRRGRAAKAPRPTTVATGEPQVRANLPPLTVVLDEPLSRYAEAVRSMKISADIALNDKRPNVIGFVSMLPNEGKSTAAKNYASLVAAQGERVLLIDADLRNPELTRKIAPSATEGLIDVLRGRRASGDILHVEERSNLRFLPGATHKRLPETGDVLGSERMGQLLLELGRAFDTIVIDLPPLGAVVDALAAARFIDGYFFIIEWGATPRSLVRELLIEEPVLADKTIGAVLSKVQMDKLKFYTGYASYGYVGPYQSRYYGERA